MLGDGRKDISWVLATFTPCHSMALVRHVVGGIVAVVKALWRYCYTLLHMIGFTCSFGNFNVAVARMVAKMEGHRGAVFFDKKPVLKAASAIKGLASRW